MEENNDSNKKSKFITTGQVPLLRVMGSYLCLIVVRVLNIERADRAEISASLCKSYDDLTPNKETYRSQVTGCSSTQSCILYTHTERTGLKETRQALQTNQE